MKRPSLVNLRRLVWPATIVAVLFVNLEATGQNAAPDAPPSAIDEPITPVPQVKEEANPAAALGEALFADVRLSHDNSWSCMSCHDTHSNGADARTKDVSPSSGAQQRNTNTVFNAALSFRLGWAGDFRTLEDHADATLVGAGPMTATWPAIIAKLGSDPDTVARFRSSFGRGPDRAGVLEALASYERTLLTPDSRFDLWLRGDRRALSADEVEGYRLFKSSGCIACHQGVNIGGNLFEKNGIFRPLLNETPEMMRVPSLRNVAVTGPYFHDGSVGTLNEAVQRMAEAQLGRELSTRQIDQITSYLGTLTGRYRGRSLVPAQ